MKFLNLKNTSPYDPPLTLTLNPLFSPPHPPSQLSLSLSLCSCGSRCLSGQDQLVERQANNLRTR